MPKHEYSKDNQPKKRKSRGEGEKTKILNALKRNGIDEDGFYDLVVERAINGDDNFALDSVMKRIAPIRKSVMPSVEFEFNKKGTPAEQVGQILDAISDSSVPPDVGNMIIGSIKNAVEIEANTDLKARIEAIESKLNG